MHQFPAHVAFLHCQSQGSKAEIDEKSWHLLQFNFDLAALRKWLHFHFASLCLSTKGEELWPCPWYESPLGCTVPRSKKMKQKLNLAGNPNETRSEMFHDFNLPCKLNAVQMGAW